MSERQKTALVCGAGGFIGSYMVRRLQEEGYWVRGVDLKYPEFSSSAANEFIQGDLTDQIFVEKVVQFKGYAGNYYHFVASKYIETFDEIYQFAADMGGAGYIFTGDHDADVMHNSALINLNILDSVRKLNDFTGKNKTKIFYSSSACMYPEYAQMDVDNPGLKESDAYPAGPDSEYGWEKLFSERLYLSYSRNYDIPVRIARYHNIFGPEGTWTGGKEKSPAAMCRKIAELPPGGGTIDIWGDGEQTRSFLFIDECIEATRRLMDSDFEGPVNIGSEEMVTINTLADTAAKVSGKEITKNHIDGPLGVRGRNSNNNLIREKLGWDYTMTLEDGILRTYDWINAQVYKDTVMYHPV
jgi:nucleoside-diphosphate-sugar epimerase